MYVCVCVRVKLKNRNKYQAMRTFTPTLLSSSSIIINYYYYYLIISLQIVRGTTCYYIYGQFGII